MFQELLGIVSANFQSTSSDLNVRERLPPLLHSEGCSVWDPKPTTSAVNHVMYCVKKVEHIGDFGVETLAKTNLISL